jgi:hypothetical protein
MSMTDSGTGTGPVRLQKHLLVLFLLRNVFVVMGTLEKSIPGDEETSEGMQVWEEQRETGSQAKKDACA